MTKSKNSLLQDLANAKGKDKPDPEWEKWPTYKILMEIAKYKDNSDEDLEPPTDFSARMGSGFKH